MLRCCMCDGNNSYRLQHRNTRHLQLLFVELFQLYDKVNLQQKIPPPNLDCDKFSHLLCNHFHFPSC